MFKFAGAVLDFYDDPSFHENAEAQTLLGDVLVPLEEIQRIPDSGFAIKVATAAGVHRKFPVYNKAATALSGQYFDKIAAELPDEIRLVAGSFLKKAHVDHSLPLPASLMEEFDDFSGRRVEYAPDPDPIPATASSLVKVAEYAFMDRNRSMHILEKVEKAYEIDKVASDCGEEIAEQEVWDYVPKADYGPLLKEALVQRETLVAQNPMLKEAFAALMEEFPTLGTDTAPFVLYEFDKMAQFDTRYGMNGIIDPFMAAWGGSLLPAKQAGVAKDMLEYKLETVARHRDILLQALPEKFVNKFVQDPKGIYKECAPEHKKLIKGLMDKISSGEKPSDRPSRDIPLGSIAAKIDEGL